MAAQRMNNRIPPREEIQLCPDCKTPSDVMVAYQDIYYCWLCCYNRMEADAKLGRMVRKLAEMNKLVHYDGHHWQVVEIFGGILLGDGDTPEQALEAAGIKDD